MVSPDKNQIRTRVATLVETADHPQAFDLGLQDLLQSLGSEEQAAGAAHFIPGMGRSYGVSLPVLRTIAAELARWGQSRPSEAFSLAERLWRNGARDERVIAAKMLERWGRRAWAETLQLASSFVDDIRNWEECDQLACFGLRSVVQRHPEAILPRCQEWVRSDSKGTRRFGVAVLTSLPKDRGYRPSAREFAVLNQVMADEAREVQDAVAWALREIGKRHPVPVAGYLRRSAPNAQPATRRIIREAMRKLPQKDQAIILALLEERS